MITIFKPDDLSLRSQIDQAQNNCKGHYDGNSNNDPFTDTPCINSSASQVLKNVASEDQKEYMQSQERTANTLNSVQLARSVLFMD